MKGERIPTPSGVNLLRFNCNMIQDNMEQILFMENRTVVSQEDIRAKFDDEGSRHK